MPLTDVERAAVRYHLGYPGTSMGASLQFGLPRPTATLYMLESAMGGLLEVNVPRVRRILGEMDSIENQMSDARKRMKAIKLGNLETNQSETAELEGEYNRWGNRLADIFLCPYYPFALRFRAGTGASMVQNIRVS
jgi:hypothetical protein